MSALSETWQVTPKQVNLDLDGDTLREECGVFGIYGHPDAAAITALGLHALQHRGQEAAGIVSYDGSRFHSERRLGLVGDTFSKREVIDRLPGHVAIGHVRYSTTGATILRNVQPLFAELNAGGFAVGHNGNLTNGLTLRRELVKHGAMMQSTTDTEVILHLVARSKRARFIERYIGALRARESHVPIDVVVPVPDSGVPAAVGYSQYSGVPFELGIIRNHYVGRTFIQPTQSVRELGVRMKHSANRAAIEGKRIILIDDSLVRGTTSKKIVRMMRDAGAREVHFRLASPQIVYPDYYGIDLPDRGGLLAATHSIEEMRELIGADSLAFLSIDGLYRAVGEPGRDPANPKFSDHCFTGAYPTHLTDQTQVEPQPRQLSLLAE